MGPDRLFQKVKRRKMRKVKSYCRGCFTPKKMEFRRKDYFVARTSDPTPTFVGAPTKIELEQNKLAQAVTNLPFKKQNEITLLEVLPSVLLDMKELTIKVIPLEWALMVLLVKNTCEALMENV